MTEAGAWKPYCEPCGYKHIFRTPDELGAWMLAQDEYYGRPDHPWQPYRCPSGNGWHTRSRDDDARVKAGYNIPPPAQHYRKR